MNSVCADLAVYAGGTIAFALVARAKASRAGLNVPIVEPQTLPMFAACGMAVAISSSGAGSSLATAIGLAVLAVCSASDSECGLVFDCVTIPGLAAALCAALVDGRPIASFEGAVAAGAATAIVWIATRSKGIGLGDVKAAAVLGAALGPAASLRALGLAFVSGAAVAVVLLAAGRVKLGDSVRFAPFIALGALGCVIISVVHA